MSRPLKFKTPEELQERVDSYFVLCKEQERPISITGLAIHLDCYRETISNYMERDEFFDTVKKAKQRVENFYEERLTLPNVAGVVFALKNFDWSDKQDVAIDHSSKDKSMSPAVTRLSDMTDSIRNKPSE